MKKRNIIKNHLHKLEIIKISVDNRNKNIYHTTN